MLDLDKVFMEFLIGPFPIGLLRLGSHLPGLAREGARDPRLAIHGSAINRLIGVSRYVF
jgi:hypothetical protein